MADYLVLFHGNCPDGITAAWAAWRKLGDRATYHPLHHPVSSVPDCRDKHVVMLDMVVDRALMEKIHDCARSFIALDHHEGAEQHTKDLSYVTFDKSRSGAGLAWDHFHPGVYRPLIVTLIEDRDLRLFRFSETDPVLHLFDDAGFHQLFDPHQPTDTFKPMDWFAADLARDRERYGGYDQTSGRLGDIKGILIPALERQNKFLALCRTISKQATPLEICGVRGLAVNCPVPFEDAIGTMLADQCDGVGVVYHHSAKDPRRVKVSLRSRGSLDVMAIAQKLGGNGHFNASGCNILFSELSGMFAAHP